MKWAGYCLSSVTVGCGFMKIVACCKVLCFCHLNSFLLCRLTQFTNERDELLRVLERGVGDDESSEEEERLRWWWRRRRVRPRGVVDNFGREEGNDRGEEPQGRGIQTGDSSLSNEQTGYPGESSGVSNGHAKNVKRPPEGGRGGCCKAWATDAGKWRYRAQRSAWPHWVYRQFDAYDLARRAAGMHVI